MNKSTTPTSAQYDEASLVEKVNYLESELATTKSDIATIKTAVSSLGSSGSSVVKSIQRHHSYLAIDEVTCSYTISTIDPSKSIVIIDTSSATNSNTNDVGLYLTSLTSNKVTFAKYGKTNRVDFSYQVIEFY